MDYTFSPAGGERQLVMQAVAGSWSQHHLEHLNIDGGGFLAGYLQQILTVSCRCVSKYRIRHMRRRMYDYTPLSES